MKASSVLLPVDTVSSCFFVPFLSSGLFDDDHSYIVLCRDTILQCINESYCWAIQTGPLQMIVVKAPSFGKPITSLSQKVLEI